MVRTGVILAAGTTVLCIVTSGCYPIIYPTAILGVRANPMLQPGVPPLKGVVLDWNGREPLEGVRVQGVGKEMDFRLIPSPSLLERLPETSQTNYVSMITGPDGRFTFPGNHGSAVSFWKSRYMPVGVLYKGPLKSSVVTFVRGKPEEDSDSTDVEWEWDGHHTVATVYLRPIARLEPRQWEPYLRAMYRYGFSWAILGEASDYVSRGGELTEGMLKLLVPAILPRNVWARSSWKKPEVRRLAGAIVDHCRTHPESPWCTDPRQACFVRTLERRLRAEGSGPNPL